MLASLLREVLVTLTGSIVNVFKEIFITPIKVSVTTTETRIAPKYDSIGAVKLVNAVSKRMQDGS